jgi:hypothetical protein
MDRPVVALVIAVIGAVIAGIILAVLHIGSPATPPAAPAAAAQQTVGSVEPYTSLSPASQSLAASSPSSASRQSGAVTAPDLEQALLPAGTVSATATTKDVSTNLSGLEGVCSEPVTSAKVAASELIWDGSGPVVAESIGYWDSAAAAGRYITTDRNSLAASADGCSYITYGQTAKFKGIYAIAPPSACLDPGARFATAQFARTPPGPFQAEGYIIELQCGPFTFAVSTGTGNLQAAQVYLNSAVDQFAAISDATLEK